jgi:sugar (pentulose or hexulose) kinase
LKTSCILIFDIGKTAKKALLFDHSFHVLEESVELFEEVTDEDGFPSEDLQKVSEWVTKKIAHYLHHSEYELTAINFSAYGASLVHLDRNNIPLRSFYNYLKPLARETKEDFFSLYNRKGDLPAVTASPWLGMLNSGLQLFWMKKKKTDGFNCIHTTLHFPQYFPFLLTGKKFTDITSIGCHTMLWNYEKNVYHDWVEQEDLIRLFPPVMNSSYSFPAVISGKEVRVGIGVHDSSAALMPYLVSMNEPFLLLSTGTWNIAFNPFNHTPLTPEELEKDCLCYLTFEGKPVKASRIFLGHEHELQLKAIASYFNTALQALSTMAFDPALFHSISGQKDSSKIIYPIGMEGTGPFPGKSNQKTCWSAFSSLAEAYHSMIHQLVKWQIVSLNLIDPQNKIPNLIVVGGFTRNQLFLEILKREAKHLKVLLSDHPRAAAMGAAWLVCGPEAYKGKNHLLSVSSF